MRRAPLLVIALLTIFIPYVSYSAEVKESDLAGSWYPSSKAQLETQLVSYLNAADPEKIDGDIVAVIVPHAGYRFSGPVAAYGFKAIAENWAMQEKGQKGGNRGEEKGLEGGNKVNRTLIILGFSHRNPFDGIAILDNGSWRTPLGEIPIDEALARQIEKNPRVEYAAQVFTEENSVEMQVPFAQMIGAKKIVPLAFGTQSYADAESLAATLAEAVKDSPGCVVVASTDLSHYRPYADANNIDRHTMNTLNGLKAKAFYDEGSMGICELCGLMPVTTALLMAQASGCDKIKELKYANSGDITGDKKQVVGYVSAAIYRGEDKGEKGKMGGDKGKEGNREGMLSGAQRKRLLEIARESITSFVRDGKRKPFSEKDPLLNAEMGAFVTLHENGELRGCIGNMVGEGPLYKTVADMAVEAATGDPRFMRLSPDEINKINIEISVLSPLKRVESAAQIKIPGEGVIVRRGFASGVYLPQVAEETGWDKEQFLTSLCAHKAGLPPDAWKDPATEMYTFTAEVFGEQKGE